MKKTFVILLLLFIGCWGLNAFGQQAVETINLLSLQEGTMPVISPAHYGGWSAEALLDESPGSGWILLQGELSWKLVIDGHTDSTGSPDYNQKLSLQRADAVRAYLLAAGVDAGRLQTMGFGSAKPVADSTSEMGRAQNRRVELVRR